jgi:acyl-CoA synthetase (NDP forming)
MEEYYKKVLDVLMNTDWPDLIYVIHVPPSFVDPLKIANAVMEAYLENDKKKPIVPLFLGRNRWEAYRILREAGLPTPLTHISGAKAIDALIKRGTH